MAQLQVGNPPPPPPPQPVCAVSVSVLYLLPWILLPIFPATPGGGCVSNTGRAGELWTIYPNVTVHTTIDRADFCIDNTGADAIPLYATLVEHNSGGASLTVGYDSFVPGPPPASTFDIPAGCKC